MSTVLSISTRRSYGVARVCRVWRIARAGIYRGRHAAITPLELRRRPGPQGPMPDGALVEAIRPVLADSPFHGEGYRKVWPRLRHKGLRTSGERVRRLMRENGLSAANRTGRPRGPKTTTARSSPGPSTQCGTSHVAPSAAVARTGGATTGNSERQWRVT